MTRGLRGDKKLGVPGAGTTARIAGSSLGHHADHLSPPGRLVTPIEELEVPATVQPLLASRIDRLAEREKRVLQIASVIGVEFTEPVLAQVAELPKGSEETAGQTTAPRRSGALSSSAERRDRL